MIKNNIPIEKAIQNISNENLLVNSDFRNPINLSGKTVWESNDDSTVPFYEPFTIQGWYRRDSGTGVKVLDDCIRVEEPNYNGAKSVGFQQELDKEAIKGKTITASFKVKNVQGSWLFRPNGNTARKHFFSSSITKDNYQVYINTTGLHEYTFNIKDDLSAIKWATIGFYKNSVGDNDFIELEWIKLELGDKATPLETEDSKLNLLKTNQVPLLNSGDEIIENDDLNNFVYIGNYFCNSNGTISTLKNKPPTLSKAFRMTVNNARNLIDMNRYSYFIQKIESYDGREFKRPLQLVNGEYMFSDWIETSSSPTPRKNILINPNFAINQRNRYVKGNSSELATSNGYKYFADCWKTYTNCKNGKQRTYGNGGMMFTNNSTSNAKFGQLYMMETDEVNSYHGKVMTLSFNLRNKTYSQTFILDKAKQTNLYINVDGDISFNQSVKDVYTYGIVAIGVDLKPNETCEIEWAKLEEGDSFTGYEIPNYDEEIDKCRRFYQRNYIVSTPVIIDSGREILVQLANVHEMRIIPTVKFLTTKNAFVPTSGSTPKIIDDCEITATTLGKRVELQLKNISGVSVGMMGTVVAGDFSTEPSNFTTDMAYLELNAEI